MTDAVTVSAPATPAVPIAPLPAAVVVLGRAGVEREAVEILLRSAALDVVDLVRLEAAPAALVAVLVEPTIEDWRTAQELEARVVVVLDGPASDERTVQLMLTGADAVLHAGMEVERLVAAVRVVGIGNPYLSAGQARAVVDRLRLGRAVAEATPGLTRRETEILLSIERGEPVRETAAGLGISVKTVQNLQSRLFRKLGARNRPQAIARAYELGVIDDAVR